MRWTDPNKIPSLNTQSKLLQSQRFVDSSWNVMAHGDAWEGKWRGNWRMEWVASTLHTTSEHGVSSITTADAHTSAASSRLNWRAPADLNGLIRFAERRNLVSARVSSHFNWLLHRVSWRAQCGRWDFVRVTGGGSSNQVKSSLFFIYLLASEVKSLHLSSQSTTNSANPFCHSNSKIIFYKPTVTWLQNY